MLFVVDVGLLLILWFDFCLLGLRWSGLCCGVGLVLNAVGVCGRPTYIVFCDVVCFNCLVSGFDVLD